MTDEEKRLDETVSRYWYEADVARADANAKRLLVGLIITIVLSVATIITLCVINYRNNQKWIELFNEYDFQSYEITADENGNANFIGNDNVGGIYN